MFLDKVRFRADCLHPQGLAIGNSLEDVLWMVRFVVKTVYI